MIPLFAARYAIFKIFHQNTCRRSIATAANLEKNASGHGFQRIGIVGAGQMGIGIAQVASQCAHLNVYIYDADTSQLERKMRNMEEILKRDVGKGKITEGDLKSTLSRIFPIDSLDALAKANIVVEAISENPQEKFKLLKQLDGLIPPDVIFASNTSSISITKLASMTSRPDKVIGLHFMNPVPIMKLVEIIPGLASSAETVSRSTLLARAMGKVVTKSSDVAGFIANRLLMPYINEAIQALYESLGTREDIDTTMKLGCNHPMGPLELADFIGLDTCLGIMRVLHSQLGEDKYRPSTLLIKYVDANWLGRKSGKGFYDYPSPR